MLTVTALTNAEYLISSVALSIDEYYAGVGESPGVWAGRWAEELGAVGGGGGRPAAGPGRGAAPGDAVRICWRGPGPGRCGRST